MISRTGWAHHPLAIRAEEVFAALDRGATVELVATFEPDLVRCQAGALLFDVLTGAEFDEFDYVPVHRDEQVVGLLRRREVLTAKPRLGRPGHALLVSDLMHPLDESILVAAETGLLAFIAEADRHPCRLVIKGTRIAGIITIADLQKLPVRLVLFALVTHVELLMLEVLRARFRSGEDWSEALNPDRRSRVDQKWRKLRSGNLGIDKWTATEFGDKVDVLMRTVTLDDVALGTARRQLVLIEELRNSVTHAGDYALTPENACKTVETVRLAQAWVVRLMRLWQALRPSQAHSAADAPVSGDEAGDHRPVPSSV